MGQVVVLGEPTGVMAYALAGALAIEAEGDEEVARAWASLPPDTSLVVLTPAAAKALGQPVSERSHRLIVTMPA